MSGSIVAIHVGERRAVPLVPVDSVRAVAGSGLEGDRYFKRAGTFSKKDDPGQQVTLIEAEALDALDREYGVSLPLGAPRRNLTTRGVALNHLVGREFRVGEATLRGVLLCEPCGHMERLTVQGAKAGLVHRGGLRAEIVASGTIQVGDPVVTDLPTSL